MPKRRATLMAKLRRLVSPDDNIVEWSSSYNEHRGVANFGSFSLKPCGVWYARGLEWIDYCLATDLRRPEHSFIYRLTIDKTRLLRVRTWDDVLHLHDRLEDDMGVPEWSLLLSLHAGVEFSPYHLRERHALTWYSSLDCASGCIWDKSIITDYELLHDPS
jgi:hypothetical protein